MADTIIFGKKTKRNLAEIYESYKTSGDCGHGDKGTVHSYIEHYSKLLEPYRENSTMLEIGLLGGESLEMWNEYFIKSTIVGIEIFEDRIQRLLGDDRYNIIIGDSTKPDITEKLKDWDGFDVIVDDGSHYVGCQTNTFNNLKEKMNPGGIYIIEDVRAIDDDKEHFESLHDNCEVIDLRSVKDRSDDVLIVYRF